VGSRRAQQWQPLGRGVGSRRAQQWQPLGRGVRSHRAQERRAQEWQHLGRWVSRVSGGRVSGGRVSGGRVTGGRVTGDRVSGGCVLTSSSLYVECGRVVSSASLLVEDATEWVNADRSCDGAVRFQRQSITIEIDVSASLDAVSIKSTSITMVRSLSRFILPFQALVLLLSTG